jgi:hypothetical protein
LSPGNKRSARASIWGVSSLFARSLVPALTVACTSSQPTAATPDRWAPNLAPPAAPLVDASLALDDDSLAGVITLEWKGRVRACGHEEQRPRHVCVTSDPESSDDPVRPWWPSLRRRGRLHRGALGAWLEITPATLESVTGAVLRSEIEHSTASLADCTWRLRARDSDRVLFDAHDVDFCR